ncbi:MAG: UxaA family hydrolase [Pseudoflavonifractor sp.]
MINAMIIDTRDNVAVAIEPIKQGDRVYYLAGERTAELTAAEDITIYHKLAVCKIAKGSAVCKYGEHIGIAACDIEAGAHVHEHNVESKREDLHD